MKADTNGRRMSRLHRHCDNIQSRRTNLYKTRASAIATILEELSVRYARDRNTKKVPRITLLLNWVVSDALKLASVNDRLLRNLRLGGNSMEVEQR